VLRAEARPPEGDASREGEADRGTRQGPPRHPTGRATKAAPSLGRIDAWAESEAVDDRNGEDRDSEIEVRQVSPLLAQEGPEDGQAQEPRNLRDTRRGREARAGRPVLQARMTVGLSGPQGGEAGRRAPGRPGGGFLPPLDSHRGALVHGPPRPGLARR